MILLFMCIALDSILLSGNGTKYLTFEHWFVNSIFCLFVHHFRFPMIICSVFQQVPLSVTKCTRVQLTFTINLELRPKSIVHTVFKTTTKSSGTRSLTWSCSYWDTCMPRVQIWRMELELV